MALTIGEANAVNTLLEWVLGLPDPTGEHVSSDLAVAAAVLLADHAHKVLPSGLTGEGVMSHWPDDDEPAGMPVEQPGPAQALRDLAAEVDTWTGGDHSASARRNRAAYGAVTSWARIRADEIDAAEALIADGRRL